MTPNTRYPVFIRKRDGSLANYSGSSPGLTAHPWLRHMIQATLAGELSQLGPALVIPLGRANHAIAHLRDTGTLDPARCLLGLPHPSPASPFRERYFQAAKAQLISQTQRLSPAASSAVSPPARVNTYRRPSPDIERDTADEGQRRIVVSLTRANLSYGHIYLRSHLGFFPADTIGAGNARVRTGTLITLHFAGLPELTRTDIAGDKAIFRCRSAWREFFARHGLQPGDQVAIVELSPYEYRVEPRT